MGVANWKVGLLVLPMGGMGCRCGQWEGCAVGVTNGRGGM